MSSVWDNLAKAAAPVLRDTAEAISEGMFEPVCDSPIEAIFGAAFYVACSLHGTPLRLLREFPASMANEPFIVPQFVIAPYRVDFLIGIGERHTRMGRCIVVECDGHDFHEKTKEQAAKDKARDRALLVRVAKVIRFTGSELHARPYECADEAWELMAQVYSGGPGQ